MGTEQAFSVLDASGQQQATGILLDGKLHQNLKLYHDGQALASMQYKNGLLNGQYISLHAPQRPAASMHYLDGKLHGKSEFFTPNGSLVRRTHYHMGVLHGMQQDYYPDGSLMEQSLYALGALDGDWYHYHPNGKVAEKRHYLAGKQTRAPEFFDERGAPKPAPVIPGAVAWNASAAALGSKN